MRTLLPLFGLAAALALCALPSYVGCSAGGGSGSPGSGASAAASPTGGSGGGLFGCDSCQENAYQHCDADGNPTNPEPCGDSLVCVPGRGCLACTPGLDTCVGNEVHACTDAGQPGDLIATCDPSLGQVCSAGVCTTECDAAADSPSNVGCEFWALDLPNERGMNDAAAGQWGVVISNVGQTTATVVIEKNSADVGQLQNVELVTTLTIPPSGLEQVPMDRREVTGWVEGQADPPGPPMTWLSSTAFRITSTTPLIVYQFNNFQNSFSNDASLLIPRTGLGSIYRVLGFPTANPVAIIGHIAGIPDHSSVTVVGVASGTVVNVKLGHAIVGDAVHGIPAAQAGDTVTTTLSAFDVLNLASFCGALGCTGDMTGTIVESSEPVAVFSSGERAIAPYASDPPTAGAPPAPPGFQDLCCTDHFEKQMFPVTTMGKKFVVTRSPLRSHLSAYKEPDVLRFLGVAADAAVTTNLPAPNDSFALTPGQLLETWTTQSFVLETSEPIIVGQILVSQSFTEDWIGDPSLMVFPPVDQYRSHYVFLVPDSWTLNYVVFASPVDAHLMLDAAAPAGCVNEAAGTIDGTDYEAVTCPLGAGAHVADGDLPFGISVYGYGTTGSYAFPGGADVQKIYDPPPLL